MKPRRHGECDFCGEDKWLGRVVVQCGRTDRTFAACHDCRERFEDAVGLLVETGDLTVERVVERVIEKPVDRVITRTTMEPDGYPGWSLLVTWVAGAMLAAALVWFLK